MSLFHFKKILYVVWILSSAVLLVACQQNSAAPKQADNQTAPTQTATPHQNQTESQTQANTATSINTTTPINIDWTQVDSKVTPINPDDYAYPFAIDSIPVKNYATAYNITPKQAQHSMMLAMASPEALTKVLEQIQGHYLGHSLTDGADMSLVIYTSDAVVPSRFDYVFADKFGEGLVLPVVVMPSSQAKQPPQVDMTTPHGTAHQASNHSASSSSTPSNSAPNNSIPQN